MKFKEVFPGVWRSGRRFFTENLVPGERVFTKNLVKHRGIEYREWDPYRSKPAAALAKGLKVFPVVKNAKILYLGIANGTTATFFSDIVGKDGIIYGVEISERSMRDLNQVAEKRGNIVPILADARKPETYSWIEPVDVIYEDVATNDQSEILIRNCEAFLKRNGFAAIAIKARSIDVTSPPKEIYKREIKKLSRVFKVLDRRELDPYERDHLFLVMKWK